MTSDPLTHADHIEELSVSELFNSGQYIIPIYQRNYAWGEPEVEQLIQDIMDVTLQSPSKDYFIGTLVVYRRDDNSFEVIDGQQRHTTLSILLAALKNAGEQPLVGIDRINLDFDSRPRSGQTLRKLFSGSKHVDSEPEERSIRSAYEVATRYFSRFKHGDGYKQNIEVKGFTDYLLAHVKILRVVVPADTDLNHYFEIMNNRGEQLEKHEVLKARLMNKLSSDAERSCFARVWDACEVMGRYVQLGIDSNIRDKVFGKDWSQCPNDFKELSKYFEGSDNPETKASLESIIKNPVFKKSQQDEKDDTTGTFSSVINFSNFLLHVLRLMTAKDVPLDDKRLLPTFNDEDYAPDPKDFLLSLLKCRMLFDRYIIKRENEEDWSLKALKPYDKKRTSFAYVNSSDKQNQSLLMILSMFHVSFPALVYKHWLNAALKYLCSHTDFDTTIETQKYLRFLEKLSDDFFFGRFGVFPDKKPFDYYDLTYKSPIIPKLFDEAHLSVGTNVQNFIFNRLDYLLWKRLKAEDPFDGVNMDYVRKRLNGFSFTFRTSVEHYYPQKPLGAKPMKNVDVFGNLCLISRSNNSKLSNYLPTAKKEHYEKSTRAESLKQVFMMSYDKWEPEPEGIINDHEQMMVKILKLRWSSKSDKPS